MINFPNAKINIGLNILRKRKDNFHDIQTLFYPIAIKDILEIVINKDKKKSEFVFKGKKIDSAPENNIIVKAYNLLKKNYNIPPIKVILKKVIPIGAGLGGGSSDAAFMIKSLNNLFSLNLTNKKMAEYALKLGADCPFFIYNKPAFATGIGNILNEVDLDLSTFGIIIIKPKINISTAKIYSRIKPNQNVPLLTDLIKKPVSEWKNFIKNDFEKIIFNDYPFIKELKDYIYGQGAIYSAMSGSGSAVFGIFDKQKLESFNFKFINKTNYYILKQ